MEILVGIAAIGGIGIIVFCVASFVWSSTRIETSPQITFNAFRELYAILTQNEKDFLASIQKDIDAYRKENLREMKRILEK